MHNERNTAGFFFFASREVFNVDLFVINFTVDPFPQNVL